VNLQTVAAPRRSCYGGATVTIGVLFASQDDPFQLDLWKFLLREALARDVALVGFCGHGVEGSDPTRGALNIAYRLAGSGCLDGVLAFSNTIGTLLGTEQVLELLEGLDVPVVSLGFDLPGISSVVARGETAMTDLVRHLIQAHGRRRLALVTGPQSHQESEAREAAFRRVLAEEGVPFDEDLLFRGDFDTEAGRAAVAAWVRRGTPFDAVVCLNDQMAVGALEELRVHGIPVPGAVSVTGFDDVQEAVWVSPPLTTVRQPLEAMAVGSLHLLLERIAGKVPRSGVEECLLEIRESCGCPPRLALGPPVAGAGDPAALDAVLRAARAGDIPGLLAVLSASVGQCRDRPETMDWWRSQIIAHRLAGPEAADSPRWSEMALGWLTDEALRWERQSRMDDQERSRINQEHSVRILGFLSLEDMVRYGEARFPSLGIPRFFLVLFDRQTGHGATIPTCSRWIYPDRLEKSGVREWAFDTENLMPPVPGFSWGRLGWLVTPLVFQDEALGYLLLECGPGGIGVSEMLRRTFSTAVKGALLMEELQAHKATLEVQVQERTRELQTAYRDLQEVSNRTMQIIGQDIHDDLCQHLVGISMLASVAEETLTAGSPLVPGAMGEIRSLVDSAVLRSRQFARTLYPPGLEEHGLVSALENLVGVVNRPPGVITFTTDGDCGLKDPSLALQLYRIVQESLTNALRHSGSEVILVRLVRQEDGLLAEVRDFGRGLGPGAVGSGMGTRIMGHRAESIRASLEIFNLEPGVCVSCFLPDQEGNHG